jgi:hypothetical protein
MLPDNKYPTLHEVYIDELVQVNDSLGQVLQIAPFL